MERENNTQTTRKNFVNLFTQLTKICMETEEEVDKNYQKGKHDALDEVIQWYNMNYNNDKYVTANSLIMFLQDKIEKTKNQINNSDNNPNNDIKPIFDINEIKRNYNNNNNNPDVNA